MMGVRRRQQLAAVAVSAEALKRRERVMTDDGVEEQALEQMQAATEAIRTAVLRLLRESEIHPQLVILAVAKVAGELGAGAALASGMEVETTLAELAEVVRQAGRDHEEMLRAEGLPVAGNT